mgnify:CR=1 FL=1
MIAFVERLGQQMLRRSRSQTMHCFVLLLLLSPVSFPTSYGVYLGKKQNGIPPPFLPPPLPVDSDQTGATWLKNYFIGGSRPTGVSATGAISISSVDAEIGASSANPRQMYPISASHFINNGSSTVSTTYDFNCQLRSGTTPTVGAYEYKGSTNPGWAIATGFKPTLTCATTQPSTTAHSSHPHTGSMTSGAFKAFVIAPLLLALLMMVL